VAWGDYDGDGDLALVVSNFVQPTRLYRNDAGVLTASAAWSSNESGNTESVAWGDYDGDGDLDLAAGNAEQPTRLYRNDAGVLTASAAWSSTESGATQSVAWGDYDGDGDLDLVVSNFVQPTRLYRNDAGVLTASAIWSSTEIGALSVAWGDMDGDGDLDLAAGNYEQPNRLYHNTRHDLRSSHANPIVRMQSPDTTPPLRGAYFYATPHILDQQLITLNYTLVHPDSLTVARVIGQYSLDGGGHWRAAAPINTQTTNLSSSPGGVAHTYTWDTFADGDLDKGVFGQSDNVVFRIIAVPSLNARANQIPGPYLYGAAASSTLPFRVRGAQPRVLRDGVPLAGALVYRLRPPSPDPTADPRAQLMRDGLGRILRTNQLGYLAGQSPIALNDSLIALQPIGATSSYALYFTSAAPTATGLAANTVVNPGVQALTISSANPLVLLNLSVSLEWDARKENTTFLNRLQSDLQRVSALLYDFTDGQVALGQITIYQNRDHWYDVVDSEGSLVTKGADIRIHASNRLRPNASQGGITSQDRVDPNNARITYEFGHVRIGTVWNSDGDVVQKEGDDWARALAHELGHYALFLDDNYLGLDGSGRFTTLASCRGAMSDPYRDDWTEFQPASAEWDTKCQNTLSARLTGRSDWQTIKTFYDNLAPGFALNIPAGFGANTGPSTLPLAVTQFTILAPSGSAPLDSRLVPLNKPDGTPYAPSGSARAFLFSADGTQIADLGQPTSSASQGQAAVRGARTNDRLCVFDLAAAGLGCASLTSVPQPLTIAPRPDWQPDVIVTPVTSRTLTLEVPSDGVGTPAPSQLTARLFAADSAQPPASVALQLAGASYRGTLNLSEPVLEGYVYVEVPNDASSPARTIVSDYTMGGTPAPPRRPPRRMRRRAPLTSPDGQVILYSEDLIYEPNEFFFFALQTATRLPAPPEGATVVGQGYRLIASDSKRLANMAINMAYAASEAAGQEVAIYYYGKDAQGEVRWQRLPSPLGNTQNEVTAQVQGAGLYVLLARPWKSRLPLMRR